MTEDRVEKEAPADTAAAVGRLAGRAVSSVGRRLLRSRTVRETIRRTARAAAPPPEPAEPKER